MARDRRGALAVVIAEAADRAAHAEEEASSERVDAEIVNDPEWRELPPPSNPMAVARELLKASYHQETKALTLRHWRGTWMRWTGPAWVEVEDRAVRSEAYHQVEHAYYFDESKPPKARPWAPNRRKMSDLLEAMAAVCHLHEDVAQPGWTDDRDETGITVACANGLLEVDSRTLLPHDPRYFNQTSVAFDYDPDALEPIRWLGFLDALWGDDTESIAALQEFMGYVISGRLDLDTILLMVGPTRGGKGAVARVLTALLGKANVAGPTLSSLGTDFGLAPLLGKSLAIISDARLGGRDSRTVVERLLAISGRDRITVDRKYRDQWSGQLPTRFLVISNELPQFGDASAAIVGRFLVLQTEESWLGREDRDLEPDIHRELSAILNWTFEGLDRLKEQGRFTRPPAMDEAIITLQNLSSPVAAWVRDCCQRGLAFEVRREAAYNAWKQWAEDNGHRPSSEARFGRDLKAVIPTLRSTQPLVDGKRIRFYRGFKLKTEESQDTDGWPSF